MIARLALLASISALAFAGPIHAQGIPLTGAGSLSTTGSAACAYGVSLGDGCPSAALTASFTVPTLFSTGPQSGQNYGTTRPTWNVAAIDYGVGYDAAVLTLGGGSANDPFLAVQNATRGITPVADCVKKVTTDIYEPAANAVNGFLECTSSTGSIDIEGMDFGDHGCVALVLLGYTGNVKINNSRLASGPGCAAGTAQVYMPNTVTKNPNLVLTNNELDGREAYNIAGSIGGCTGVAPSINCVLHIASMSGSGFNVGDTFDDAGYGFTGSGLSTAPVIFHATITSGAPGSCASGNYYCGPGTGSAGDYNVSYFYQTWGGTSNLSPTISGLPASGATCNQTSGATACQNIVGLENGMLITGGGGCIPAGAYINGIPSVTQVTMSVNATCTVAATSANQITFSMPAQTVSNFTGGLVASLLPVVIDYSGYGNSTISYNNIHDTPLRPINLWANGALQFDHNFCTGMTEAVSWNTQHGECFDVTSYTGATNPITLGNWSVTYNTFLMGTQPTGLYAAWAYTGNPALTNGYFIFPNLVVDNNTVIGNCAFIGGTRKCQFANGQWTGTNGNGLLTISRNQFNNVELKNNYVDPTGATSCVVSSADIKTFRGNISNGLGGVGTDFEITSNNIDIPLNDTIGDIGNTASGLTFTTVTGAGSANTFVSGGTPTTTFGASGTGTGFAINDTLTLTNGSVVTVTSVSGGLVKGVSFTSGPTLNGPFGAAVQASSTSGSGVLNSGSYIGPTFISSGYVVNEVATLANGAQETVDSVTNGVIVTYHQTTAPTMASGPNVPATGTSAAGPTNKTANPGAAPVWSFTGNTVHTAQNSNTGAVTWSAYTAIGDFASGAASPLVVSGNVNLSDGTPWGSATPYLQGTCNGANMSIN